MAELGDEDLVDYEEDEAVEEGGKTEEVKKCVPRRSTAVYGTAISA